MKILNLDINSKNKNIGQVEKCDSTKLICTLEENDYSNSTIRILGKKADKTLVEQIVEITGNKIEVTLNKQFTSCEGITRIEINIVTDKEEWTSNENYFYVSDTINSNIIKSINDVKTLDDLDQYLIYAKEEILNIKAELETVSLDKLLEVKNILEIENNKANTSITTLKALIDNSIQAKKNLDGSIGTATTINSELTTTTTQANTSKDLLVSIINTANTSKSALDGSIGSATSIDTTLKATTTSANTSKSNLEKATTTANTSKSNLESVTVAANNKKKELDTSITGATNKIVEITNKNTEATSKITTLTNKITEATTCKSNLDTSIVEGEATKNAIDEAIVNGDLEKVTTQLSDMSQEITDARVGYFGKEHASLQDRLNDEFQFVTVDNSRGMFVEQSTTTGSMKIENSIEGRARDTVIKGRTLQNLEPSNNIDMAIGGWNTFTKGTVDMFKPNTEYTVVVIVNNNKLITGACTFTGSDSNDHTIFKTTHTSSITLNKGSVGVYSSKFTTKADLTNCQRVGFWAHGPSVVTGNINFTMMILEGDHTANPPTTYHEGIKSLSEEDNNRISILSAGKNLLNLQNMNEKELHGIKFKIINSDTCVIDGTNRGYVGFDFATQEPSLKLDGYAMTNNIREYYANKHLYGAGDKIIRFFAKGGANCSSGTIGSINIIYEDFDMTKLTFKGEEISLGEEVAVQLKVKAIRGVFVCLWYSNKVTDNLNIKIMLSSGTVSPQYEPYKADKKDILIPVTGGAKGFENGVTDESYGNGDYLQKVDRIVLDGSENWIHETTYKYFAIVGNKHKPISKTMNNKYIDKNTVQVDENGVWNGNSYQICVKDLSVTTVEEFKRKLSTWNNDGNPFVVYYELAEPILHKATQEQNNNLATFKDITHVSCLNKIAPSSISAKFPINLANFISRLNTENKKLEYKNIELENNLIKQAIHFKNEDLDLMASNLELDFRIMDIEFVIESSIVNTKKHKKGNDIMSPYTMMKKLILGGRYEKEDMEYKISVYLQRGKITEVEAQELRDLILANEIIS